MNRHEIEIRITQRLGIKIESGPHVTGWLLHMYGLFAIFCTACYINPDRDSRVSEESIVFNDEHLSESKATSVLLHELTHSTGRANRLNRYKITNATSCEIAAAKEEMIAEITARALMHHFGMNTSETDEQSLSYIERHYMKLATNPEALEAADIEIEQESKKAFDWILANVLDNMESGTKAA